MPEHDNQAHDMAPFDPFAPFKALVEHWSEYNPIHAPSPASFDAGFHVAETQCRNALQQVIAQAEQAYVEESNNTLTEAWSLIAEMKGKHGSHHPR